MKIGRINQCDLAQNEDFIGNYDIPDEQQRVDQILDEMPQNALDKLVRDVGRDYNNDGIKEAEKAGYWNRAVIIIGVADGIDRDGDGEADSSVAELIQRTQGLSPTLREKTTGTVMNQTVFKMQIQLTARDA